MSGMTRPAFRRELDVCQCVPVFPCRRGAGGQRPELLVQFPRPTVDVSSDWLPASAAGLFLGAWKVGGAIPTMSED
jgi:hypothetical protein